MKLLNKTFFAVILLLTICNIATLSAKNKSESKIYAFGFAASFNDSTLHFTEIQELDSVSINHKNKFLVERENYSYQLRNYLESQGLPHRTCIISFAFTQKDAQKKYNKMRNKYVKRGQVEIKYIPKEEFKFTTIKPEE